MVISYYMSIILSTNERDRHRFATMSSGRGRKAKRPTVTVNLRGRVSLVVTLPDPSVTSEPEPNDCW